MKVASNSESIEAWNGVLFDRFVEFRDVVTTGLGRHGEAALRAHPPRSGERVLDIGCGFGDTTQRIADLVGWEGEVVGVDAAERFIETARAEAGPGNISFEVADVEVEVPGTGYDLAFSRMGTMFFGDPIVALRRVRRALVPGGRLCMVVWRRKADNEFLHLAEIVAERYLDHPDPDADSPARPGPFSMADADATSDVLVAAGFDRITFERCDLPIRIGTDLDSAVEYVTRLGPAGELIRLNERHGEKLRPQIAAEIREELEPLRRHDGVWGGASSWIVSAVNPV